MSTTGFTNLDASIRGSRGFFADIDRDLLAGIRAWRLWTMLGWNDIRQRYRRSVLGPFWITISMAVFITLLGVIYSHIFKIELKTYLPYLSLGYIIWGFIATDHRRELRFVSGKRTHHPADQAALLDLCVPRGMAEFHRVPPHHRHLHSGCNYL